MLPRVSKMIGSDSQGIKVICSLMVKRMHMEYGLMRVPKFLPISCKVDRMYMLTLHVTAHKNLHYTQPHTPIIKMPMKLLDLLSLLMELVVGLVALRFFSPPLSRPPASLLHEISI